jgi:hypothetical protein
MLGTPSAVATNTVLDNLHEEDVKVNRFRLGLGAAHHGDPGVRS